MAYPIADIEGVTEAFAEKLKAAGISTVEKLLEEGKTKKGRADLAEKTGIDEKHLLTFVNHADLFRIKGIAGQFSELLEAAGVDTVKEFRNRNAENLHARLVEVNEAGNLSGRVPSLDMLKEMIEMAKTLEPMVSH
jgi:nucleotidyltransferase/DNA polymerase involved in DNA repair